MPSNQLRIIGGQWRGRKLPFPDAPDLRPTPDRVRETLFNWLQTEIVGAHCLDLFAGSGALGLEALSRGAEQCVFLDTQAKVIANIQHCLDILANKRAEASSGTLSGTQGITHTISALEFLQHNRQHQQFDIVFLDPPYRFKHYQQCYTLLETQHWLSEHAAIYIESQTIIESSQLPANWRLHRQKKAGNVHYHLALRD